MPNKPNSRRALLIMLVSAQQRLASVKSRWDIRMTVWDGNVPPYGKQRPRCDDEKPENSREELRTTFTQLTALIEELTIARQFVRERYQQLGAERRNEP